MSFVEKFPEKNEFCSLLGLTITSECSGLGSEEPKVKAAKAVLLRLLSGLEECWRSYLKVTPFIFCSKDGRSACAEEMTFEEFYNRCVKEWNETKVGESTESNGELLRQQEETLIPLRKKFLEKMDPAAVESYWAELRKPVTVST
jgi:hypothetical protein